MLFAQGGDFPSQRPDEPDPICRRAGNEVVVPVVRHAEVGGVIPVHTFNLPFVPNNINRLPPLSRPIPP